MKTLKITFLLSFLISSFSVAQDWDLIWSDEFNSNGAVNSEKWFHQTQLPNGWGWYNNEQQHYTNRLQNSYVENGKLNIVAIKENFNDQGHTKQYTSARLNSKFAFRYGKVEVRAKLPTGQGTWPAIWTLGKNVTEPGGYWANSGFGNASWPACGEIDIMEHWGTNQNYVQSATHTPSSHGGTINHGGQMISTASSQMHTYGLVWTPEQLIFSVDGVVHYTYNPPVKNAETWPFDAEQYLLLNLAIEQNIAPNFVEDAMEIDYVRVYQTADSDYNGHINISGCLDSNASNYDADATLQGTDEWGNTLCAYASCADAPSEGCMYANAFSGWHDTFNANDCSTYGGTPCEGGTSGGSGGSGCLDANADNYNAEATVQGLDEYGNLACNYSSCDDIPDAEGCMYTANYSAFHDGFNAANCEQYGGTACTEGTSGSSGCLDSNATNYNAAATAQAEDQYGNILCVYVSCDDIPELGCIYAESFGAYHESFDGTACSGYGGTPCGEGNSGGSGGSGCLDVNAGNYNAEATVQGLDQYGNSTCIYASCDDIPDAEGCSYADAYSAFHEGFNAANCEQYGGTACTGGVSGCTDATALNYNADATVDDETCDYPCSPAWNVKVTDQNHSIFINGTWTDVNGNPLAEGSALGVFYTDLSGNLVCAGYTEISEGTVQIAAMGDDVSTEEVDGLLPGQELVYQVWDVSTCEEFSVVITYSGGPEVYTSNGITFISSVVAAPFGPSCQTLEMPSGWFTLSTYMITDDMDVASVLAPIIDHVVIAKNNEGNAYLVEWDFNGIGDFIVGQGYQIKTDAAVSIEVCGDYATPEDHPIDILAGWNMIGYLRTEPSPADAVLADMNASGNLIIAKDYNGNAYLPEWNFNGIGDMVPGQGYQLKTSTADVLQYLSNDASNRIASTEITENNVSHFAKVAATGNNMTIVIEDAAWDVLPKEGAEIAAFDKTGTMIGSAIYSSPATVLTAWGDDATTSSKDGLEASEAVSFKVWTSDEVRDFTVKEWAEGSSSYNVDAINVAAAVSTVNPETADIELFEAVPNPTSARTTISFYTPKTSFVNITVYNILGHAVEVLTEAQYNKGPHAVTMDTNTLEAGTYFYRLNSDNFTSTKSLTLIK